VGKSAGGAFSMAKQYRVCSLDICPIRVKNNKPCPISASRPPTSPTSISELKCIRPLRPPLRNFSGQAIPSPWARYLHLGVKHAHPCPISVSRCPTAATHIFAPTYILYLRFPPYLFDGQAVPSAFVRYLLLSVKTTHPYPISASRPPTTATHILKLTYILSL
jgi:hypothetical protein